MTNYSKDIFFGGGTGLSTLLRGVKNYIVPTAIVSMADSGGSTGVLRDRYGVLPPGDIRRCLVALASDNGDNLLRRMFEYRFDRRDGEGALYQKTVGEWIREAVSNVVGEEYATEKTDALFNPKPGDEVALKRLKDHRFTSWGDIKDHTVGNLILAALQRETGGYMEGARFAARILNIKGYVLPVSIDEYFPVATDQHGNIYITEEEIDKAPAGTVIVKMRLSRCGTPSESPNIYYETQQAVEDAKFIGIGPGDHYSSILANLMVDGVRESLKVAKGKDARVAYICNLVTEPGETGGFTAGDHLEKLMEHIGEGIVDHMVCNNKSVSTDLLKRYEQDGRFPVEIDRERIKKMGVELIEGDFIGSKESQAQLLRHDPDKLAKALISITE